MTEIERIPLRALPGSELAVDYWDRKPELCGLLPHHFLDFSAFERQAEPPPITRATGGACARSSRSKTPDLTPDDARSRRSSHSKIPAPSR